MEHSKPYVEHNGARYKLQWSSRTQRVDIETGETISEKTAKAYYIKIQTHKKITYNANKTKGHIDYTVEYRRNPQQRLWE